MKIPFFKPYITGNEIKYISDVIVNNKTLAGDGEYTKKVHSFFEKKYKVAKVLLTTSGTSALELAVRLLDLKKGDEVIAPSFTFSSTINAILLSSGVKVVFADIQSDTLNIDPKDIVKKITGKTKAVVIVHYAGVSCDMDKILKITKQYKLKLIEDAAQAIESKYKNKYLGTFGDFGCISFHETKNITCGEGGALFINNINQDTIEKAEIIREKGTNRSKFYKGLVDKYTWVDVGGSYLPSDILAAYLFAQLEQINKITRLRLKKYKYYLNKLEPLQAKFEFKVPYLTEKALHNGHIFYLSVKSDKLRDKLLKYLRSKGVGASFHYIPLHSSPHGQKLGYKPKDLPTTELMSSRIIRLPIYSNMSRREQDYVLNNLKTFFNNENK